MATLFDYIDWRGDLSFSQCELCEVDSLILSQVCYLDLYRIVPASPTAKGLSFLAAAKRYVNAHRGESNSLGAIIPPRDGHNNHQGGSLRSLRLFTAGGSCQRHKRGRAKAIQRDHL